MQHRILGTILQVLEIALEPGEQVTSVAGELSWMTDSIQVQRSLRMNNEAGTQVFYGRSTGGAPMIYADYFAVDEPGIVAFSAKLPGQIIELPIKPGDSYLVHRNGFLCGTYSVEVTTPFQQNLATGAFGVNGLFLRTLTGSGTAFVEFNGELVCYDLPPGKAYNVHPAHVGMVSSTVQLELTRIPGVRVDDILLLKLTGPGKIWLHSMPIGNIASATQSFLPTVR